MGGFPSTGVSGTVTYNFYSGNSCNANFTTVANVNVGAGNSVPSSGPVTPVFTGPFSFSALYSGDPNNNGAVSPCEPFNVVVSGLTSFSITASRASLGTIMAGEPFPHGTVCGTIDSSTAKSSITLTSLNGFSGMVSLTATVSPLVQNGPSTSVSPSTITLAVDQSNTTSLTVSTNSFTAAGTYTILVTGTSGASSASVTLTLTIVSAQPSFAKQCVSFTHHLSLSKDMGIQTWTAVVFNPTSTSQAVQVVVSVMPDDGLGSFTAQSAIVTLAPGQLTSIPVTQSFQNTPAGTGFSFTVTLIFGDTPSNLNQTSFFTFNGSFTVKK
jgi:hypothetical protein